MKSDQLQQLLQRLERGELGVDSVMERLSSAVESAVTCVAGSMPRTASTSDAQVDLDRTRRCGFPEVVFCQGKTTSSIINIFAEQLRVGQDCFGTRVSDEQAAGIMRRFSHARCNSVARTVHLSNGEQQPQIGKVAVISAGTSDGPVAQEAVETLHWMRVNVSAIQDVGVAGPHRLPEHQDQFSDADAVVVVAGMEGALPSIVGGFVSVPVVAVPTSVGYGASFGGLAALLGMLNSCAANVTVVNIDAGFKAAYVAGLIARRVPGN